MAKNDKQYTLFVMPQATQRAQTLLPLFKWLRKRWTSIVKFSLTE